MNNPKVTVLMSVYNTNIQFLEEAIASILNQTFEDFEFVIINDASEELVSKFLVSYNDKRIKIIENQSNIGLTRSLNKGLMLARGSYIARMDADDIASPNRLQKQVDFLDSNLEIGVLGTFGKSFGSNSKKLIGYRNHNEIKAQMLINSPMIHPSVMIRKSILLDNLYNEDFRAGQDYELWSRLITQTKFANLSEPLLQYRTHKNQVTTTRSAQENNKIQEVRDQLLLTLKSDITRNQLNVFSKSANAMLLSINDLKELISISNSLINENNIKKLFHKKSLAKVLSKNLDRAIYIYAKNNRKIPEKKLRILEGHALNRFSIQKYIGVFL